MNGLKITMADVMSGMSRHLSTLKNVTCHIKEVRKGFTFNLVLNNNKYKVIK